MLIYGALPFLIYISDLSDNFTSLFSVVHDINQSLIGLNDDLEKINSWAFQWKMSFKRDINKQAQEVIFSCKFQESNHSSLTFSGPCVIQYEINNN